MKIQIYLLLGSAILILIASRLPSSKRKPTFPRKPTQAEIETAREQHPSGRYTLLIVGSLFLPLLLMLVDNVWLWISSLAVPVGFGIMHFHQFDKVVRRVIEENMLANGEVINNESLDEENRSGSKNDPSEFSQIISELKGHSGKRSIVVLVLNGLVLLAVLLFKVLSS